MNSLDFGRYSLSGFVAAATLAACGGSQSPIGALRPQAHPQPSSVSYQVLHSFGASSDGAQPMASLINVNGTLYGTTEDGGTSGSGTVFALTP